MSDNAAEREVEGLPEFQRYRPRAGHPDWALLDREAEALAEALGPKLSLPARGRAQRRRRLRAYRTTARNYLTNWRLNRQGRHDLRPLYFIWTTLRTCNFACTYCDDHRGRKYPDLPNDDALDTQGGMDLLRVMRTRTPAVYFAGGEPTVRRDLPQLTREARRLAYYPIIINTNGSLVHRNLAKKEWHDWLANTDIVVVSLDGLHLEKLAKLWVFKRPEHVIRNLLLLRRLSDRMGFKLMVNTVIDPDDLQAARDVLDLASDLGIWFCPVPKNIGPRMDPALRDNAAYDALVRTILARKRGGQRITGSLRMNQRLLAGETLDCRNTLKPHIDHDGRLAWPCKASVNVEPRWLKVTDFDGVDSLYDAASRLVSPHAFHGPADNQCGADCNWAQNYTTDTYVHGLEHPFSLLRDVGQFLSRR